MGKPVVVAWIAVISSVPIACERDKRTQNAKGTAATASTSTCGMRLNDSTVAFCDTFDAPFPILNRSGQLDGTVWGVSRMTGAWNLGQELFNAILPATIDACGAMLPAPPPDDVVVCNGQLREAVNDNGGVTSLAMYPKQPFDFTGRTGTIAFDVSNDTLGIHDAWPEFWLTDQPTPVPFSHAMPCDECVLPRNGLAIRFAGGCPNGTSSEWSIDSFSVITNYEEVTTFTLSSPYWNQQKCVAKASGPDGQLNHVEIRISQTQVDVYATDPGSSTLVLLNSFPVSLSFTRGLAWIEDVHYNADKAGGTHKNHTFAWDNFSFDGPQLPRDLSFDVLDSLAPASYGLTQLGFRTPATLSTLPMGADQIAAAQAALLMFNAGYNPISSFTYTVNGHKFSAPSPAPPLYSPRTIALDVPLSALVPGPQTVSISTNVDAEIVTNVNLVLVGAGGVVSGGTPDAGIPDAGIDAGTSDGGSDAGVDAGTPDAGMPDAGPPPPPPAPGDVRATPMAQVNLAWTAIAGATGYKVYRGTAQAGPFSPIGTSATPSFTDQTVVPGTTYWYTVSAVDAAGEGPQSLPVGVTP